MMSKSMKIFDVDAWPPNQPENFTLLVLIHYQEQHTGKQVTEMTKLVTLTQWLVASRLPNDLS